MKFFRLEDASRATPAEAFSGLGGLHAAGRWHTLGHRIVYSSQSLALASLEKLVHAHSLRVLAGLIYFEIEIPDALIGQPQPEELPAGWNNDPVDPRSQSYGDRWLSEQRKPALRIPSAIIPIEFNCLINPLHPKFSIDWVRSPQAFSYDPRIHAVYRAAIEAKRP